MAIGFEQARDRSILAEQILGCAIIQVLRQDEGVVTLFERTLSDVIEAQFIGDAVFAKAFGDIGWNRNRRTAQL